MVFNIFSRPSQQNQPAVSFTPLPGSFPEDNDNTEQPEQETILNAGVPRILKMCLYIPLTLLYYLLNILLTSVEVFKPIGKIFHFYTRKDNHFSDDLGNQFVNVIDVLSSSADTNEQSGYTFDTLYNVENGMLSKNMIKGGYTDILRRCSSDGKFAIISFFNPILYDPFEYVRKILTSNEFVECVTKYNCVVWFCDVTTPQGLQTANSLKIRQFPFLGALGPQRNNKMKLLARVEGQLFDYDFSHFEAKLASYYSVLVEIRRQRQYQEMQRLLREQQDSRYQESLERDQERDRVIEESQLKKKWLAWRKSVLVPEPSGDGCRVSIRLENERIIRRFDASLTIEEIYAYVALYRAGLLSDTSSENDITQEKPNYEYQYDFQLYSPVPRTRLEPTTVIKEERTIYPSGTIVVEFE
ncbi:clathrin-mediated endocytosis regulator UBX3 [Kluyveromyces lactis]|uniref:KLLA0F07139p n=1 Tax=Kluyveromyces lactis (strain ATCC 8585 / CBS 2359 / DSM 70799 / NBRC 1267 / NRRL Y-1140 / WM37) TaxID=284590 RepID=Q6CKY5_KLULA|nr:uncharacterized protein KLLA0_F07139g [Kluyveromyces lactis]CAG98112.1 KLLA0F07139p [Kluyveromyces lactis]|eukprot:XP_455404.1 uncharacterized protein KLLA0_F07139g [Kluyveromyces lactis]